ncbi:DUF4265 domain-containing protein [Kutzneria albida]|uniref:DUF4265 domain-containing protein n=1 Tax=Kutzneria albida TaxID=43357 RepID=UPI00191C449F|nr:DUF4265 domain-containing protein [Kutzneria albida]
MTEQEISPQSTKANHVRVRFLLQPSQDGWPPVDNEGLWGIPLTEGELVQVDNIPWFARNVAVGDIVRVSTSNNGTLWAMEKVSWSGACTIRVIPFPDGPLAGSRQAVLDVFSPLGVDGEGIEQFGMVALSVPPNVNLHEVKRLLHRGESEGWWEYEEGCIGDAWESIKI